MDRWALETLEELLSLDDDDDDEKKELVEVVPIVCLHRGYGGPIWPEFTQNHYRQMTPSKQLPILMTDPRLPSQNLSVEMLSWQNMVHRL